MPMMPFVGSMTSPAPLDDQAGRLVGDREHRFEPSQHAVGPPILGQLDDGAARIVGVLSELFFEWFGNERRPAADRRNR